MKRFFIAVFCLLISQIHGFSQDSTYIVQGQDTSLILYNADSIVNIMPDTTFVIYDIASSLAGRTGFDTIQVYRITLGDMIVLQDQFADFGIPEDVIKQNLRRNGYFYKKYLRHELMYIQLRNCSFMFEVNGMLCRRLSKEGYFNVRIDKPEYIKDVKYIPKDEYKEKLPGFKNGVLSLQIDPKFLNSHMRIYMFKPGQDK